MGRPCASCTHPKADEIDRKLRAGISFVDVSRWLTDTGQRPVQPPAIGKHAKDHLALATTKGRRPVSGRLLEGIVEAAEEGLAAGELAVTLRDGIAAQKALDARAARDLDRDIFARITLILSGKAPLRQLPPPDPDREAVEGEFREMLSLPSGD